MAIYEYRGITQKGKNTRGIIDAASTSSAREKLRTQGIYLQEIGEVRREKKKTALTSSMFRKRATVTSITRQLAFLLGAALPVDSALEGVIDQIEDGDVKKMMINIKTNVKEGRSVSQAFAGYPEYFNQLYVSTVHAGEVSGKLDVVFERLSAMYEKNRILIGKLRSSLTYPLLMLFLAFVVVVFLVSFIVPTFARLFVEFEQALPLPTRMLMALSGFVTKGWWAIFIVLGLAAYVLSRIYKTEKGKTSLDSFVLKLPLVRTIVLENFRIRFCSTMALLLSNGVGIIESLQNTGGIFRNSVFTSLIRAATDRVKKGERLSRALASGQVFTSSLLGMIHAGEAGDRVAEVLDRIARNGEVELEERLKTLTSLVEPVIIMVIGIFVGFVVLSIMLPIFQINQMFG